MRRLLATVAMLVAFPAGADQVVIDLAIDEPPAGPVAPGPVNVRVRNRLPRMDYTVSVRREVIPIPPFQGVDVARFAGADACSGVLSLVDKLTLQKEEKLIGALVTQIRAADMSGCTGEQQAAVEMALRTTEADGGTFEVRSGEQLVIVVMRSDGAKSWTKVATAGERGRWLTTYGASVVPDRDERFFTRALGNGKFQVAQEDRPEGLKVIPSVYFTWISRKRQVRDWAFGPTAGLGVKNDRPAVFAGLGLTYNWNLGLVAGVSVVQESRVSGRYRVGQELSENLAENQLHRHTYRPRLVAGVTFRFGSNPFGDNAAGTEGEKKKATKPAEVGADK